MKEINRICFDCGMKRCPDPPGGCITFSNDTCDVCGEKKSTTAARHYPELSDECIRGRLRCCRELEDQVMELAEFCEFSRGETVDVFKILEQIREKLTP